MIESLNFYSKMAHFKCNAYGKVSNELEQHDHYSEPSSSLKMSDHE